MEGVRGSDPVRAREPDRIGAGNVVVSRNDDTYMIRFQGTLSDHALQPLHARPVSPDEAHREARRRRGAGHRGRDRVNAGSAGGSDPADEPGADRDRHGDDGHLRAARSTQRPRRSRATRSRTTRAPSSSARRSRTDRRAAQTNDPFVRPSSSTSSTSGSIRYPSAYLTQDQYVIQFQGELRKEQLGPGLDTVTSLPTRRAAA